MSCFPTEQEVFQCLCKVYGSSAAFSEIAEQRGLFPHGSTSAETWLRKTTKDRILVTEDKKGKITKVHAFSTHARLCLDYSYTGKCDNNDCTYLHICRAYMTNSCSRGVTCQLNHHFHNQRDRAFLSKVNFDEFTDLQLQMLVLSSTPQICVEYNTAGKCNLGDSCTKIHICHGYLRKCCSGTKCGLLHETAMDTDHTKAVLKRLLLNNVDRHEVMKMILDNELSLLSDNDKTMLNNDADKHEVMEMILDNKPSLSENVTTKCHTHQDKPDTPICPQFPIGTCDESLPCTELHCSLPFHWQYKVSLFDEWKCFIDEDNLALEKMYCDVNVGTLENFKPAQPLDLSCLKRQGGFLGDLEYEITIDLDNMTIACQRPMSGEMLLQGLLRRLSTLSYFTRPSESIFMNWKWYWKNGNVWHTYDKDFSGSDLQGQIEQAYQDMLRQGKTKAMYQFVTSENVYNLVFDSTREMYQFNVRTGTQRQVKRRPEKPISDDDLNEWDRGDSTAKKKKVEVRPVKTHFPSQISSSMQRDVPYTRVALDAASTEFREVEQLFKRSMNDLAVIRNIDRVQNPLMWEEYCRNKCKMMRKTKVDEKRLFYGSSPENVGAICEKNFDLRIRENNGRLMLGQGTYFAVDAVSSHSYVKTESGLFQYMFLAKVLVDSYAKGHRSFQRPPAKNFVNGDTHLYDSCVDNISNPTIFVVFDRNHFFPEYVIQYLVEQPPSAGTILLKNSPTPSSSTQSSSSASAVSNTELTDTIPTRSSDCLDTASLPSDSATQSSYSDSGKSNAELTDTTSTRSSDILDVASLPSDSDTRNTYSASVISNAELTDTTSIRSSGSLDTASLRSVSATQSSYSASLVSNAELTDTASTRISGSLDTASLPSDSDTQSSYSASVISYAELTDTTSIRSSDSLDTSSLPSDSDTQSSYSASVVSNAELTQSDTTSTRGSDSLDTASLPSDSATQSSYSASVISNTELTDTTSTRSFDSLDTASLPIDSATQSSYSASVISNAELADTTSIRSSDSLDTASLRSVSATQSSYSASVVSDAELTDTTSTRSLPSGCTTQSSYSSSTLSSAELTDIALTKCSDYLGRASTNDGTGAESSYSTSALFSSELVSVESRLNAQVISMLKGTVSEKSFSASVVSGSDLTSVNPTRSRSLKQASLPSGFATQSSYSAAAVYAELTGTTPTRSSDSLDTASLQSGSATQSSNSISTVSNVELTGTSVNSSPDSLGTVSFRSSYNTESGYSAPTVSSAELTDTTLAKCPASTKGGTGAEVHSHQDKPDASSICPQFLIGRCDKDLACPQLHCSLPFHWQYKVSLFDEWNFFIDEDNLALEKMYCDVNVGTIVNFKPAQPLDLSRLKRQGRFPGDLEYEITINLDNMTIAFQRPRGGEGLLAGLLRRLSTLSYVTRPYESMFTKWKWYWKDNGNIWHLYDKDCSERDLQEQIEQAYQDMLSEGKTKAMYQFLTSENVYNLFFDSTREMYQVTERTGTQRQVKRRPEKRISDDDLNEWACGDSTSKRNITEERPVTTNIPSHVPSRWSSMRPNVPYTRAALDVASAEFQEVEKLFKRSMNGRAVIEKIDRVHNPLIWEEYSRNKYKMMRKAHLLSEQQVSEKKLFHGTSPENVEAICEKNFDPRINNKNKKLKLGRGTYFAVNALCSHSYAKRDSDLIQYMFLAKVLVGCYTKGHPSYLRPPLKDFPNVDNHLYMYDSCVDNVSNPAMFVVFDRNHFYPEYVIQYLAARRVTSLSLHLKKIAAQRLTPSSSTQSSFSASA